MVHGNFYGIQYEIILNKEIDFYNDLLPIWISTRSRIEMENNKLIVISHGSFNKQLYHNSIFNEYVEQNNEASYQIKHTNEDQIINNKYLMVNHYSKYVKNNYNLPEPMNEEEYKKLVEKYQDICYKVNDNAISTNEYLYLEGKKTKLFDELKVQRIIYNSEYFEEIKNLEKNIINQITLTNEQNEFIQKVITHPKLEGLINWHGLNLVSGFF